METQDKIRLIGLGICLAGLLALSNCARAVTFDIEAGEAIVTLNRWAAKADAQLLYDFQDLLGVRTQAVRGDLPPLVALERMLRDSGFSFDPINERTVAVFAATPLCRPELGAAAPLPPCLPSLPTTTIDRGIKKWQVEL